MKRRQTIPEQWLIVRNEFDNRVLHHLPRATGVLLLRKPPAAELRRLRQVAAARDLLIVQEGRGVAGRVHNMRELTRARLRGTSFVLISPIFPTRSHPDWRPLGRMRAATLVRLSDRRAIALGGMNRQRFTGVQPLGFIAWAGISTWLTAARVRRSGAGKREDRR